MFLSSFHVEPRAETALERSSLADRDERVLAERPCREASDTNLLLRSLQSRAFPLATEACLWSAQRDSHPRPSRWRRDALLLSYARSYLEPPEGLKPPPTAFEARDSFD